MGWITHHIGVQVFLFIYGFAYFVFNLNSYHGLLQFQKHNRSCYFITMLATYKLVSLLKFYTTWFSPNLILIKLLRCCDLTLFKNLILLAVYLKKKESIDYFLLFSFFCCSWLIWVYICSSTGLQLDSTMEDGF